MENGLTGREKVALDAGYKQGSEHGEIIGAGKILIAIVKHLVAEGHDDAARDVLANFADTYTETPNRSNTDDGVFGP